MFDSHKDKTIKDLEARVEWLTKQLEAAEAARDRLMETIFVMKAVPYDKDAEGQIVAPAPGSRGLLPEETAVELQPVNHKPRRSWSQIRRAGEVKALKVQLEARFRAEEAAGKIATDPPRI